MLMCAVCRLSFEEPEGWDCSACGSPVCADACSNNHSRTEHKATAISVRLNHDPRDSDKPWIVVVGTGLFCNFTSRDRAIDWARAYTGTSVVTLIPRGRRPRATA